MRTTSLYAAAVAALVLGLAGTASAAPDAWLTTKVKLALLTAADVSSTAINVDTIDGRVTLQGAVPSQVEKDKAAAVASAIDGVTAVRNQLTIEPTTAVSQTVADDRLESAVSQALTKDPALAKSQIKVASVSEGLVTLGGSTTMLSSRLRAIETARAVPGVRRVADKIEGPMMLTDAEVWRNTKSGDNKAASADGSMMGGASDMWITSAVKVGLIANADTPASDINVDTTDGVVTLFGIVPTAVGRQAAETTAGKVDGVKKVVNQIQVVAEKNQAAVKSSDADIKDLVEKRVDDDVIAKSDISVEVNSGVVRLTGTVNSQSDRLHALTLARATSGVRSVVDQLQVAAN